MLRNEYLKFMRTLNIDDVRPDVRKLANIVLENFNELVPLGANKSARTIKLVEMAQGQWDTVSSQYAVNLEPGIVDLHQPVRLKLLSVGPFRGFAKEETLDLNSQIVLVYGPNGSGKSSFFEALEFGLLNSVEECQSKRFSNPEDYLKNAYVEGFEPPVIQAISSDNDSYTLKANESQFRFCFIEKNRIDNFSRIASHTPARQKELISNLFGLDNFNYFVKNFNRDIKSNIDLKGKNAEELQRKRADLEFHKKTIEENESKLNLLATEEQNLADSYQKDMLFSDFILAVGTNDHPGEIQRLEAESQRVVQKSDLKASALAQDRTDLEEIIASVQGKKTELTECSEGLSYKQLYEAIIAIESIKIENCPACKTPLSQVTENPFQFAKANLAQLEHLSRLEQQHNNLVSEQQKALKSVYSKLEKVCQLVCEDDVKINQLRGYLISNDVQLDETWWRKFIETDIENQSGWLLLEQQVQLSEQRDVVESQLREVQLKQLRELRALSQKGVTLKAQRKTFEDAIKKSTQAIMEFDKINESLIAAVEQEKRVIANNVQIAEVYSQFVILLTEYNEALPGKLVADLGERVVELYNALNCHDATDDLIETLRFPMTSEERIMITLKGNLTRSVDALHILSEGHIRCLGLAILLAKNLKENCPFLIFDDPVNAIDEDHREAIRQTLFGDRFFRGKQIILTCHGEQFFNDIQNAMSHEKNKNIKNFVFKARRNNHIQIDYNATSRNYILSADTHFDKCEIKYALINCRLALENLTTKIWTFLFKLGHGRLSIIARSRKNSRPELRNLTEQLKEKLSNKNFTHPKKENLLSALSILLSTDGSSREWRYLNEGSHDDTDKPEFDQPIVKKIIDALRDLDNILHSGT